MKAKVRNVLSRFNSDVMYGHFEIEIGNEFTPERELGRLAVLAAIEYVCNAPPSDIKEEEFELTIGDTTSIFYLDCTY
jgi:hypothetical protein